MKNKTGKGIGQGQGFGPRDGQGHGANQGSSQGSSQGKGRGRNNGGSYSTGGFCICMKCGEKIAHQQGIKCTTLKCPNCGHTMIREEMVQNRKPSSK